MRPVVILTRKMRRGKMLRHDESKRDRIFRWFRAVLEEMCDEDVESVVRALVIVTVGNGGAWKIRRARQKFVLAEAARDIEGKDSAPEPKHENGTTPETTRPGKLVRFKVDKLYRGFAQPGDTLLCRPLGDHRGIPCQTPRAKEKGLLGKWFVIIPPDGEPFVVLKLQRCGSSRLFGQVVEGPNAESVEIMRHHSEKIYQVVSVHPGTDRPWRTDAAFVAAIEALGIPASRL
jgi:hypothetical protein